MKVKDPRRRPATPAILLALILALVASPALIAQSSTAELPDDIIADVVETRLIKHQLASDVLVKVQDGVVTLTGAVDTLADKRKAEKLAMEADDVRRVVNDLQLKTISRSSSEIAGEISRAVDNYVLYTVFDWVEGRVQDGRVMLDGYVTAPWKKEDLARRIEQIPGVESIENTIEVLSPVNDDLRISLVRRIYGDLLFLGRGTGADQPIHIVVRDNGDVRLEGVVRNKVEKRQAGNIARQHPWTFEVENNLIVPEDQRASAPPTRTTVPGDDR